MRLISSATWRVPGHCVSLPKVTGAVGDHFTGLAADIFASAGDPCDNELRLRSEKATIETCPAG